MRYSAFDPHSAVRSDCLTDFSAHRLLLISMLFTSFLLCSISLEFTINLVKFFAMYLEANEL